MLTSSKTHPIPWQATLDTVQKSFSQGSAQHLEMLEALDKVRLHYFASGEIDRSVRDEISASWQRCRAAGLEPESGRHRFLEGAELERKLRHNAYLLRIAIPVIETVQRQLTNGSCLCATYLTDNEGIVLHFSANELLGDSIQEMQLRIGSVWSEETVGTNAISLALLYDRQFYTYASEHYLDSHVIFNCVTAPVHNNDGETVGAITVTFYKDFYNDFLMALIATAAALIEKQFLNIRNTAIIDYTLNDASDGVLILDSKARLMQINRRFRQLINEPSLPVASLDIYSLFRDVDFKNIWRCQNLHTSVGETFLSFRNLELRVSLDVYRIENYGTIDGYLIVCRDVSDIIAMSQQFAGSHTTFSFETIITRNRVMLEIIEQCRQVSDQRVPILLEGESGTGKEVFAQAIHNASHRKNKPFVAVNCAALPISLVESELFGYEKGSFTDGLSTGKAGKFEMANGGTIFLDEIGELPLDVQAKLLRVLDNYRITRIGGRTEKKLDIRVIAATNRDLYAQVQSRTFREDLFYRINVMNFTLPPLSQRKEDIPLLIAYFIDQLNMENRGISKRISDACIHALSERSWKGNVRELQNAVTRAYYLCGESVITTTHLPQDIPPVKQEPILSTTGGTRAEMEEVLIRQSLVQHAGSVAAASAAIGLSRATFYRKMKTYQIDA